MQEWNRTLILIISDIYYTYFYTFCAYSIVINECFWFYSKLKKWLNGEIAGCSTNSDAFKIAQWARRYDVTQFECMFCKKVLKHNTQCFQTLFQYSAYKSHSTIAKLRFSDKQVYIKKRCTYTCSSRLYCWLI